MAKEFAKRFYNSKEWRKCRAHFIAQRIAIDGGLCQVCRQEQGYIVHHKTILTPDNITNPDITLNEENLLFECKQCHDREEAHLYGEAPRCIFDINGNPIERPYPPSSKHGG